MLYSIDSCGGASGITPDNIPPDGITVGCLSAQEFASAYQELGFPDFCVRAFHMPHTRFSNGFEVYDHFSYGVLHLLDVQHVRRERRKVALFIRKNLVLLVTASDPSGIFEEQVQGILDHTGTAFTMERFISRLFTGWITGSSEMLEQYERRIVEMEGNIWDNHIGSDFNRHMLRMKTELVIRREFYDELAYAAETIQADENDLFGDDETFVHLRIAVKKLRRLSDNAQLLCENLVHVREAYQSAMDYRLNEIMKIFTVITAVFLPLSLIASWYGMNFVNMPELHWKYGYVSVACMSVLVAGICFWIFKRKKWL